MTQQEIFDAVYQHFISDRGGLSINDEGQCLYRGPHGERCAVGLFISDELYVPDMEHQGPGSLIKRYPVLAERLGIALDSDELRLLQALRAAHDRAAKDGLGTFHQELHRRLTDICLAWDLH